MPMTNLMMYHIDPDPMEFRVKNIKTRIDEMETRLNSKIQNIKTRID